MAAGMAAGTTAGGIGIMVIGGGCVMPVGICSPQRDPDRRGAGWGAAQGTGSQGHRARSHIDMATSVLPTAIPTGGGQAGALHRARGHRVTGSQSEESYRHGDICSPHRDPDRRGAGWGAAQGTGSQGHRARSHIDMATSVHPTGIPTGGGQVGALHRAWGHSAVTHIRGHMVRGHRAQGERSYRHSNIRAAITIINHN